MCKLTENSKLFKFLCIALLLTILFVTVGCNKTDEVNTSTYGVYVKEVSKSEDTCTVKLGRSGRGESLGDSVIAITEEKGDFFDTYTYTVTFDGGAIFSAVAERLTQDGTISNEEEKSSLKIVYDYDTIYKSIKSDGITGKNGRTYSHLFEVKEQSFQAVLTREIPNQATWYAVLIGVTVFLTVGAVVTVVIIGKRKNGRKTQEN